MKQYYTPKRRLAVVLACLLLLISASILDAALYRVKSDGTPGVDCEYTNITAAVAAANATTVADTIRILDSAVYSENMANISATGGDLTIEADTQQTPTIKRLSGTTAGSRVFTINTSTTPYTFTLRGSSPDKRMIITNNVNDSIMIYTANDTTKSVNLVFENLTIAKPVTGTGSKNSYFTFGHNGTNTWTNVDIIGKDGLDTGGMFVSRCLGSFTFTDCGFYMNVGKPGASFSIYPGNNVANGDSADYTFIRCNYEPADVSTTLPAGTDNLFNTAMILCNTANNYGPTGTFTFTDCRLRVDDGYTGTPDNPNTPVTPKIDGSGDMYWKEMFRLNGQSTWILNNPTFTGRAGVYLFQSWADLATHKCATFTMQGTPGNKVDLTPLTSTSDGATVLVRLRRSGSATVNYCKNTVNRCDAQLFETRYGEGGAGTGYLTDNVVYTTNGCEWFEGTGAMDLQPGTSVSGVYTQEESPSAPYYSITVNATNTIFEGTGEYRLFDMGDVPNSDPNPSAQPVHRVPYIFNLLHCTFFNTTEEPSDYVYITGASTASGHPVTDVVNASYCIFESTQSLNSMPGSNLPLTGSGNAAFAGWGLSGFPSVPTDTIVAPANLAATARLTDHSFAALGKASGSTTAVDIDNETRPVGSAKDIGADESDFSPVFAPQTSIGQARAQATGTLIDVNGVLTDKFVYGGNTLYIEDPLRSTGIKIVPVSMPDYDIGDTIKVKGYIAQIPDETVDMAVERVIVADQIELVNDTTNCPVSLGMCGNSLSKAVTDAGLSPEGLLVRLFGKVTYVDAVERVYWIDDGSGFNESAGVVDGSNNPVLGMRVVVYDATTLPAQNSYIQVTGCSGIAIVDNAGVKVSVPMVWQKAASPL